MRRYHFDIHTEHEVFEDFDGQALPNIAAVERLTKTSVAELIYEQLRQRVSTVSWTMTVRNDQGEVVLTMPFADLLKSP
jgi:hypothetical protein